MIDKWYRGQCLILVSQFAFLKIIFLILKFIVVEVFIFLNISFYFFLVCSAIIGIRVILTI